MTENEQTQAQPRPAPAFAEAPVSVTIRALNPAGFDILLTIRDSDTSALLGRLDKALGWLGEHGFTPTGYKPANGGTPATGGTNGDTPPMCPTHNTPMKKSKKGDNWYCPKKLLEDGGNGQPVYCKHTVKI